MVYFSITPIPLITP